MDYSYLELSELRTKLDTKEISSRELTKYFLDRAKKHNPTLNSFISITEEEALKAADEADDYIASVGENPLLCGIPYAAKDIFCTRGIATTAASKILNGYKPSYNATVINKLNEQKAVLLGKTNLDQFAMGSSNENSAFGPVKNPWDQTRIPGGSSGGSAAAQAAGLAPFTLGTDTGGSIRGPAALTGVSGWKPTYGRVSRYGVIAMASSLDTIGAFGVSVKDLAMLAEVMSGKDPKDATTGLVDVPSYSKNLNTDMKGVKVGMPKQYFVEGIEPEVRQKVTEAIKEIEKLGAEIVEVDLPNTKYGSLVYAIVCPSEVSSNLARYDGIRYGHTSGEAKSLMEVYLKSRDEGFGNEGKRRIMIGSYVLSAGYYDAYYKKAQKVRRLIMNEFSEVFKKVDVLLAPSSPSVAPLLGETAENPLYAFIADMVNIPASLSGLASISVPCGFAKPENGSSLELPVGLQIIGPQFGEQQVFNVGHAYQQVTDWHKKHPQM